MRGFAGLDWLINTKQRCSKCGDLKGMPVILNIISAIMSYSHNWIKRYRQGVHVTETCFFHATGLRTLFFCGPQIAQISNSPRVAPSVDHGATAPAIKPVICHCLPRGSGKVEARLFRPLSSPWLYFLASLQVKMRCGFPVAISNHSINCEIVRTNSTPSQIMTWNWQMNITHSTSTITCI